MTSMRFVDRIKETARLKRAVSAPESKLVVIYGRRRVGKSTLIRSVLSAGKDIYFQADETQTTNQIYLLSKAIGEVLPDFERAVYPDWMSLLKALNHRVIENSTLCLDEFPYLVKSFSALPSVIQNFWDTMSPRFNLVLCGSSQQVMYSELLNSKSPLYGRADCIMKLQPITVPYIKDALSLSSSKEAVEYYAFFGGIPRYWDLCSAEGNLEAGLRHLLFSADGTLIDEPDRLLRDEMRDLALSRTLLSAIGNGVCRMSEIAGRLSKNASELTAPLRRLIDLGFIERELPFGEESRNGKRSLYRIKDRFMDVYYHFVAPNMSLISIGREDVVWQIVKQQMNGYVGNCWESLCREAVSGNTFDGVAFGMASRWWGTVYDPERKTGGQIEIDVVAMSLDKKHLLVGECKWTAHECADSLFAELKAKAILLPFADGMQIHLALFLRERPTNAATQGVILFPEDVIERLT